jgi:Rrf2 family protein
MLYSGSCEYAIRALTFLAQRPTGKLTLLGDIAEAEAIPRAFLAKVLQDLVRKGLLRSARGPTGGYALADAPDRITLYDIRDAVDGTEDLFQCAVGLDPCSDETPCPLHETFKPLRAAIERYLRDTTIADLARGMWEKRALIAQRSLRDG